MNEHAIKPEIACERLIKKLREKGISDERVLEAFRKVPRHLFIDSMFYAQAYDDNALPIGEGQTISQPFVVALMTQFLRLGKDEKILEIGTGSGFQAAILAQFSRRVYTIERQQNIGESTRKRLREMGYENVIFKIGDGSNGWIQHAPFDRIMVTAGAPTLPPSLAGQLAVGGIMVLPRGEKQYQELEIYEKNAEGLKKKSAGGVAFVPLIGKEGWEK
jgi:protein-L-isoaspartate(D-aspartate) O-methyltransferase